MTPVDPTRSEGHSAGPFDICNGTDVFKEHPDGEAYQVADFCVDRPTEERELLPVSEQFANARLFVDAPLIRAELIAARERIAQLEAAAAWRPISEWDHALHAHLDYDLWDGLRRWGSCQCFEGNWHYRCDHAGIEPLYRRIPTEPTHFRPLPAAPITTDAEGGE
jgi:hypothetical protein